MWSSPEKIKQDKTKLAPLQMLFKHHTAEAGTKKYFSDAIRMWATAQGDGSPAEHGWCPLFNTPKFG